MQQAATRAADAADQPQDAAEAQETVPKMVRTEDKAAVLDMKGLLALPFQEDEPINSLRMLLVPKGKTARSPTRPGHYVVDGPWDVITFPCWITFKESMKRPDELAFCVADYGRNSQTMELVSVQSVPKPLRTRNNRWRNETDIYVSAVSNIKSFRPIDKRDVQEVGQVTPWFAQFNRFKQIGLTYMVDIQEYISMSLVARVHKILEVALDTARKLAEDVGRQDSHMESKALAKYQAYINGMQARLTDDICAFYEEPLSERIIQYSEETDESSAYRLNSPQRRALKAGKVKLL